jgi:hypothetical protein
VQDFRGQVYSRRIDLIALADVTAFAIEREGPWRLFVNESTATSSIRVTVTTGYSNSEERIEFFVAPGSATEYQGVGSAKVVLSARLANSTVDVGIGDSTPDQYVLEFDEGRQAITTAAWTPLGVTGYPRPYMNYVAILTETAIDVRTQVNGNIIFQALALPPQTLLLNQFKVGNHDFIEVRGTVPAPGQNVRAVWYNRR